MNAQVKKAIDDTFKKRKDVKSAYVSKDGENFFFDQRLAEKHFGGENGQGYTVVKNDAAKDEKPKDENKSSKKEDK